MTLTARLILLVACGLAVSACKNGSRPLEPADPCETDVTAPVISGLSASPNTLWSPNHKFVPVTVSAQTSDNCTVVTSQIVGVTSSEPVDGQGDGHTSPDWIVTGALTVLLRSERSGLNDGRTYTIAVRSADAAGNSSTGSTTVFVPHDQGR